MKGIMRRLRTAAGKGTLVELAGVALLAAAAFLTWGVGASLAVAGAYLVLAGFVRAEP